MVYIPSNRVKTGKTATINGNWVYKDNNNSYTGPYWSFFNGSHYAGLSPDQLPWREIIQSVPLENEIDNDKISTLAYLDGDAEKSFKEDKIGKYNEDIIVSYANIKNINLNNISSTAKKIPNQFYPKPTPEDYNLGVILRYFAKSINQNIWLEINKETYENLLSKSEDWLWKHYTLFQLQWTLIGKKSEVLESNKNEILLLEQRYKTVGLGLYLQYNFTQFYQGEIKENLETKGGEYSLPNGKEYIGFYHIHPTKGPMVGAVHTLEYHDLLIPISNTSILPTTGSISPPPPLPTTPPSSTSYSGGGY